MKAKVWNKMREGIACRVRYDNTYSSFFSTIPCPFLLFLASPHFHLCLSHLFHCYLTSVLSEETFGRCMFHWFSVSASLSFLMDLLSSVLHSICFTLQPLIFFWRGKEMPYYILDDLFRWIGKAGHTPAVSRIPVDHYVSPWVSEAQAFIT